MGEERHIHIHIHLDGLIEDEAPAKLSTQRKAGTSNRKMPAASVVRKWAQEQGLDVPKTGRPKKEVVDAYMAAH